MSVKYFLRAAVALALGCSSTPIEVASSSKEATALVPFPPPSPRTAAISERFSRW